MGEDMKAIFLFFYNVLTFLSFFLQLRQPTMSYVSDEINALGTR